MTAVTPGLRMPAFSQAILARLSPSLSAWSMAIGVMTLSAGRATTLVASSRPPSPTSRISASAGWSAKACRAAAVVISNCVIGGARIDALRLAQPLDQLVLADGLRLAVGAGEGDALMEAHQVRRGVDVHALAGGLQHGLEEGRHRALAVGAGDVDDRRQALLGMAELGQQRLDAAERQVDQPRVQRLQLGQNVIARGHRGARLPWKAKD